MRFFKYVSFVILAIMALLFCGYFLLPWKLWVQEWITKQIQEQNLPLTSLTLKEITIDHATFEKVTLTLEEPLTLPILKIHYSLKDLIENRKIEHLEAQGLSYKYLAPQSSSTPSPHTKADFPATTLFEALPIKRISLIQSHFEYQNDTTLLTLPFNAEFTGGKTPTLSLSGPELIIKNGTQTNGSLANWRLDVTPMAEKWHLEFFAEKGVVAVKNSPPKSTDSKKPSRTDSDFNWPVELVLAQLSIPSISLDYSDNRNHITTELSLNLLTEKQALEAIGKKSSVTFPAGTASLNYWKATHPWPADKLQLTQAIADDGQLTLTGSNAPSSKLDLPLPKQLTPFPVNKITLRNLVIDSPLKTGSVTSTLAGELTFGKVIKGELSTKNTTLKNNKIKFSPKFSPLSFHSEGNAWLFRINLMELNTNKESFNKWLPKSANLSGKATQHELNINFNSLHQDFTTQGMIEYDGLSLLAKKLEASVAKGIITIDNVELADDSLAANIHFSQVELEPLLQLILEDNDSVKATGRLSGSLPIAWKSGKLSIGAGQLHNNSNGILSLGKEHLSALLQGTEQVQQVSELLKHFEYHTLKLITEQKQDKLAVKVALKGKNPNVYNGSEVHLNVNLRGDILEAISSALGLSELPKEYLQQKGLKYEN